MKKVVFEYDKGENKKSVRVIYGARFSKEAINEYKELDSDNVKYVQGWELIREELSPEEIEQYNEAIYDYYFNNSLSRYLEANGFDPKKVKFKTFSKEKINDLQVVDEV